MASQAIAQSITTCTCVYVSTPDKANEWLND